MAAADPDLLPIGSVIRIDQLGEKYDGIYTVMDTGRRSRAGTWTSTCGAATKRCRWAAARCT